MALPAVGTRVRIRWQMDNGKDEWYDGDVTQARKSDFHVRYDVDGRDVKHDGKDRWQPLRPKPQKKTAAALDLSKGAGKGVPRRRRTRPWPRASPPSPRSALI